MEKSLFLPTIDTQQEQRLPPLLPLTTLRINQVASLIGSEIADATTFLEHLKTNTEQDLAERLRIMDALPFRFRNVVMPKMVEGWMRNRLASLHASQEATMEDSLVVPEELKGQDLFSLIQGLHTN